MARLLEHYNEKVVPALVEEFGYKSLMQVPRLQKITVNMGLGEALTDKKVLEAAQSDLSLITGKKPILTKQESRSQLLRFERVGQSVPR